jgi:hypothetical protein
MSSDSTAPGGSSQTGRSAADQFVSITSGSENFHLKSGADAINMGQNQSLLFSDDIDGQIRSGAWDIGADEYQ